jgi:uncharacterized protein YjcR
MSLSNLSSAQVARLIRLIKQKEALQAKVEGINSEITSLESGEGSGKKRGRKPGRPPGRPPGSGMKPGRKARKTKRLKEPLLKALSAAGSSGLKVKDLAIQLKVKPGNIFSWFYTTGKKIKGIKKVGEARYAYSG